MSAFSKFMLVLVLFVVILVFSFNPQSAPVRTDLTYQNLLAALGGIFVIVLLVERVTEIVISIWRQTEADSIKKDVEMLAADTTQVVAHREKATELAKFQAETKSIALSCGLAISVIVCAAGVGLLETILVTANGNENFLRGVDILLTSGLIAGGSDGFHQFTSALEKFFKKSKENMDS